MTLSIRTSTRPFEGGTTIIATAGVSERRYSHEAGAITRRLLKALDLEHKAVKPSTGPRTGYRTWTCPLPYRRVLVVVEADFRGA